MSKNVTGLASKKKAERNPDEELQNYRKLPEPKIARVYTSFFGCGFYSRFSRDIKANLKTKHGHTNNKIELLFKNGKKTCMFKYPWVPDLPGAVLWICTKTQTIQLLRTSFHGFPNLKFRNAQKLEANTVDASIQEIRGKLKQIDDSMKYLCNTVTDFSIVNAQFAIM
ncbi:hypothetical protein LguiB_005790 [Lonicera macranthoides]